jgi:hypothetical protein
MGMTQVRTTWPAMVVLTRVADEDAGVSAMSISLTWGLSGRGGVERSKGLLERKMMQYSSIAWPRGKQEGLAVEQLCTLIPSIWFQDVG